MTAEIDQKTQFMPAVATEDVANKEDVETSDKQGGDEEHQGHAPLERFINLPSSLNFEIIVQAAWEAVATTFQFALLNGGPASMVYGSIIAAFGGTAVALSLAEMASMSVFWGNPWRKLRLLIDCSSDPIVGAQYRWTANFAPFAPRFWGLIQGWITVAAWMFTAASFTANLANILSALVIFNNPDYNPQRWHIAMIMWASIIMPLVFNLYFRKLLNTLETIGGILHVVFFVATLVTLTVLAERSTNEFVFKTIINDISGWTNPGISFGIGLLTVVLPMTGCDGVLHMSAEVKRVRTRAPYSIIFSTISNAIMQFGFVICLLYTIGDLDAVTNTKTGLPMIETYYLATKSVAATNVFIIAIFLIIAIAVFNTFASVSRLTWAFACDHGLPFSRVFAQVNERFRIPVNALGLISAVCFILSLIYIGSSTAFNAIMSLVAIALEVSYLIPILFILLRKLRGPPILYGPFRLGRWGIPVNLFSLIYLLFVIIWIPFPTVLPVKSENMNYAGPILLIIIIGAVADWVISGHKRFAFPVARYIPED